MQLLRGKGLEIQRQREEASILISRFLMETCKAKLQSCLLLVSVQSWAIKMLYSFLLLAPKGILLLSLFVKVCITKGSWRSNAFVFFRIRKASLNVAKAVRKVPHSSSSVCLCRKKGKRPGNWLLTTIKSELKDTHETHERNCNKKEPIDSLKTLNTLWFNLCLK